MTLLAFLLALGVLITAHEWGHYRVAVACGVKVLTFSIGFGKPLLRWKSRKPHAGQDTEFCISLIPLGGYVKMLDEREGEVTPQDLPMAFNRQPLWARAAIVSAGPLANLLLAVCLYAATFWVGQFETQATLAAPVVGSVADAAGLRTGDTVLRAGVDANDLQDITSLDALRWWMLQQDASPVYLEVQAQDKQTPHVVQLPALPDDAISKESNAWQARGFTGAWSRAVLGDVQTGSPAQVAGLQRGDEVLRLDGQWVTDGPSLRAMVRRSGHTQAPNTQLWDISREGRQLTLSVTPERLAEGSEFIGRIGAQVGEPPAKVWVQSGFFAGLQKALSQTWQVIVMTLDMLGRLLTGNASFDNLSGPLTMADYAGRSASLGIGAYLSYLALLSVSLGVFNLLPLPVLDGGHLLYYLYEALTGRPPSPEWLDTMQRVGLAALVALMVFSLFNDVVRLGWLP
ncbi:MAG: RIP metalloprotease RseP [Burkholderiales bacterium 35-55-47]|jgi:regulator of sigma E protease|uniref:RIP metalloprotease RseP n=1 Tax=Limnohabitans sp. TaxID=1907725 RepID=UPI000BDB1B09|nr:RIP metalloprotease RseP [Limnohabitans sp.]OYY19743.1 MAG: RIP metalloprotease RseP [Burkholderiales bacterium 35-55-47]OYZ74647.1 MAG: RIP metalloprotease RseP [Burkholderiales bacterium 24-55-52]OZB01464.1 MAG: RIP metalloprotease RseP [Burkholderiales bacterium 39-55-53]HQR85942.1 RIP metalloprotease RseP [Limnohabitans sp.]HQS26142.1 RIP metalloprotease RseP [Limnohabitans sp.]